MNAWTLAWVAHTLPADPAGMFDANIFYPEKRTLAYSETLIVPALVVAPLVWLGGGPILAHNLLLLAGYVLSGLTMYVLVRSLTRHRGAALVAAVVFALYPYRTEEYAKVQLQLIFWTPLTLLAIHRLRTETGARAGVLAGVFAALQMYSCVYYGIFAMVLLAVVAIATVIAGTTGATAPAAHRRAIVRALFIGIVVFGVLCVPLAAAYHGASQIVGERSPDDVRTGSATPADFLHANPDNKIYGNPRDPGRGELRMFPGWAAPALTLAAFVPPMAPLTTSVVAYAAAGAISADLALGVHGVGFRMLYETLPPFRALRVPARFVMFVGLSLAVLAGFGVARLCRGRSMLAEGAIVLAAVTIVILESDNRPLQLSELPKGIPQVYSWLAKQPRTVICEYPVGDLQGRAGPQDAIYMYYSTRHWQPMVNGYSGFAPPSYFELLDRLRFFPNDRSIAYLRERRVELLLVHSAYYIKGNFSEDMDQLRYRSDIDWVGEFSAPNGHVTDVFRMRR